MGISMRRAIAASVAVTMMTVGGGASYALFSRHGSHGMAFSSSAMDAPRVETARMLTTPIAPPEPDLIAAKLAPQQQIVWPDAQKPVVKTKRIDGALAAAKTDMAKLEAANPASATSLGKPAGTKAAAKAANAKAAKAKAPPKPKKQAAVAAGTAPIEN